MRPLIVCIVIATMLTACSLPTGDTAQTGDSPVGSAGNFDEFDTIKRINDIKYGAAPKVKPTGNKGSAPTPPPVQKAPTPSAPPARSSLTVDETTKNMNKAKFTTNKGEILIELYPEQAPVSVENFKSYIKSGFYNGTIFHRVIPNFMIQGGGFAPDGSQKATDQPIVNEAANGLKNERGTLAMARTQVVDSATSQFFINLIDNAFLDHQGPENFGYAVFGKVIGGMEVVDLIAQVSTGDKGPHQNWPTEDVIIEAAELVE
jgi:peptidyl-prolyl cis-trans isomerase B (cyclophilin B)